MYFTYLVIDKIFTFLGCYSDPRLGESLTVMPTNGDMVWIIINSVVSAIFAFYILYKIKDEF